MELRSRRRSGLGRSAFWSAALATCLLVPGLGAQAGSISNSQVRLAYTTHPQYGFVFSSLSEPGSPPAFDFTPGPMWSVTLQDPSDGSTYVVEPDTATTSFQTLTAPTPNSIIALWVVDGHPDFPAQGALWVWLFANLFQEEGLVHLTGGAITVDTGEGASFVPFAHTLVDFTYPRVRVESTGGPEELAVPWVTGLVFPDPTQNLALGAVPGIPGLFTDGLDNNIHPGLWNMQWLAFYSTQPKDQRMFFWGTRDLEGHHKRFQVQAQAASSPATLDLGITHVASTDPTGGNDYSPLPYGNPANFRDDAVVFGLLQGDWYDASRSYREWAIHNLPTVAAMGPIRTNSEYSTYIRDADMFGKYQPDRCPVICPPDPFRPDLDNFAQMHREIEEIEGYLLRSQGTLVPHLYNWDFNSFDANWGDWFPLRDRFLDFLKPLVQDGFDYVPYLHVNQISQTSLAYGSSPVPGFLGASVDDHTALDLAGARQFFPDTYCDNPPLDGDCSALPTFNPDTPMSILCPATGFLDAYTRYLADHFTAHPTFGSVDTDYAKGMYLDVFHEPARVCYATDHPHPPGGGAYWTQAKLQVLESLRAYMEGKPEIDDFFVWSEAPVEYFVGEVEFAYADHIADTAAVQVYPGSVFVAPIFQAVFHDYIRIGSIQAVDVPETAALIGDPLIWLSGRQNVAAAAFMGQAPYGSANVAKETFLDRINNPPTLQFPIHASMIRNVMDLLRQPAVKDLFVEGQRLRDPVTDARKIDSTTLGPVTFLQPYGIDQPVVYTSAYGDLGSDGPLGILVVNWTLSLDFLFFPGLFVDEQGLVPTGQQTVKITLDADDYGLSHGVHPYESVQKPNGPPPISGNLDFSSGTAELTVQVPAIDAVYIRIGS